MYKYCLCLQAVRELPGRHLHPLSERLEAVRGPRPSVGVRQRGARRLVRVRLRGEGRRRRHRFRHVQRRDGRDQTSPVGEEQRPEQERHPRHRVLPGPQSHGEPNLFTKTIYSILFVLFMHKLFQHVCTNENRCIFRRKNQCKMQLVACC